MTKRDSLRKLFRKKIKETEERSWRILGETLEQCRCDPVKERRKKC